MSIRRRASSLSAALALLIAITPSVHAEPIDTATATARFDADAADHRRQMRDLYRTRGLPAPRFERATIAKVASFLVALNQPSQYPADTAVLFYAHDGDELAAYLIDRSGLVAADVTAMPATAIADAAIGFRLAIDVDGLTRTRAPVWRGGDGQEPQLASGFAPPADPGGTRLAGVMLPPAIRQHLAGVRHLIIVGGGAIGTIPFAALPLGDNRQLIDQTSISVASGLFDIDQMVQPWGGRAEFDNPLIVGNPTVPFSPDWRVASLPGAEREAEMMADAVGADALTGREATRTIVAERMPGASILYIAAHGVSNPRDPLRGGFLMLSGPSEEEAFLRAGDLQTWPLTASLAVLSACQSGLGMNHDGGVIGLARSFQKAGVPRVVMSLWSVADGPTLFLMERFQEHVMQQIPAEALRLAMIEARARYPDPALWASFSLFGTPR